MAPSVEDRLDQLSVLLREGDAEAARPVVQKCLALRSNLLVAKAAKVISQLAIDDLEDELVAAFERFIEHPDPIKSDKGCQAKTAIAEALVAFEAPRDEVYLRGVRHRQPEPSFGPPVDTAVPLRAASLEGLLIAGHPDLGLIATDLLADSEMTVRIAAVRVLAASGRPEGEPLLRLKAYLGDEESEVIGEVLAGLLEVSLRRSLPFVKGFLDASEASTIEAAALALGESRLEEAADPLLARHARSSEPRLRQTLLIALSMLRREAGLTRLLAMVREGRRFDAEQAIVALAIHRNDDSVRQAVVEALAERPDADELERIVKQEFG